MIEGLASESSTSAKLETNAVMHNATSGQSLPQSGSAEEFSGHGMPSAIFIGNGAAIAVTETAEASGPSRSPRTARNASSLPIRGKNVIILSVAQSALVEKALTSVLTKMSQLGPC